MSDDERPRIGDLRVPGTLEATAAEIEDLGGHALPVRLDLLDRASCRPRWMPRSRITGESTCS